MIGHDTAIGRGTVIGEDAQVTINTYPADCSQTSHTSACVRCQVPQSQAGAVDKSIGKEGDSRSCGADRGICDRAQLPHWEGGPHHRLLPTGQCARGGPGADLTLAAVRWREHRRTCHGLPWERPVLQGELTCTLAFHASRKGRKPMRWALRNETCRCNALKS